MPVSWLPGSDYACCVTFRPSQTAGLQIGRGCAFSLHEPRKLSSALLRARLPALALGLRLSAAPRVVAGHGWTSASSQVPWPAQVLQPDEYNQGTRVLGLALLDRGAIFGVPFLRPAPAGRGMPL